jgi:hypothetical protein
MKRQSGSGRTSILVPKLEISVGAEGSVASPTAFWLEADAWWEPEIRGDQWEEPWVPEYVELTNMRVATHMSFSAQDNSYHLAITPNTDFGELLTEDQYGWLCDLWKGQQREELA